MKNKGNKYLQEKKTEVDIEEVKPGADDCHQCAFCQEELR
jgi:hypothetical protein